VPVGGIRVEVIVGVVPILAVDSLVVLFGRPANLYYLLVCVISTGFLLLLGTALSSCCGTSAMAERALLAASPEDSSQTRSRCRHTLVSRTCPPSRGHSFPPYLTGSIYLKVTSVPSGSPTVSTVDTSTFQKPSPRIWEKL
jgi:hypothetical protein